MFKQLIVLLVFLMALPLGVQAAEQTPEGSGHFQQESVATNTWHWPETGIRFDYPANWTFQRIEGFEFVLQSSDAAPHGMGLQVFPLEAGDTLQAVFEDFATGQGLEAESVELGGVAAMQVLIPEDSGRQSLLIGYSPDEASIALITFSGSAENWDDFSEQIDGILESAIITALELDADFLNEQMQANFEQDQILSVGESDARIRMVEVIDFSCPHCANYAPSIDRLIQDYVMPGTMKLDFHTVNYVGAELSETAAHALYCATSLGFGWDMHDLLFELQRTEGRAFFTNENLINAVTVLENDTDGFADCMEAGTFTDLVARDLEIAEGYGVQGTPAVLIGAAGDEPAFIPGSDGEPIRGGVRLLLLYDQLDALLPTR